MHFYNARWYDSSLSRFAQADTLVPGGVQGYDRYAYANNAPLKYTDPNGHFPCYSCVLGDLISEVVNAVFGLAPDHIGISKAEKYMNPLTMNPHDTMNTYTAAGIAIQSEVPDLGFQLDEYRSGRGIGQITNGEMETQYGKRVPCDDCGFGLGMPGLNQNDPGIATVAMNRRLQLVTFGASPKYGDSKAAKTPDMVVEYRRNACNCRKSVQTSTIG